MNSPMNSSRVWRSRQWLCFGFALCFILLLMAAMAFPRVAGDFQANYWGLNSAHYHRLMARLPRSMQEQLEQLGMTLDDSQRAAPPLLLPATGRVPPQTIVTATSTKPDTVIRYTLDGSVPHTRSARWTQDLIVSTSVVVRARAFPRGMAPSLPVTRVYATGLSTDLPVVALTLEPLHLTNPRVGILANPMKKGRQWERQALLAAIPGGDDEVMECEVKVRVHGGASRRAARTRLRVQTPPELAAETNQLLRVVRAAETTDTWVLHVPMLISQIYRERLGNRIARRMGLTVPPHLHASCSSMGNIGGSTTSCLASTRTSLGALCHTMDFFCGVRSRGWCRPQAITATGINCMLSCRNTIFARTKHLPWSPAPSTSKTSSTAGSFTFSQPMAIDRMET